MAVLKNHTLRPYRPFKGEYRFDFLLHTLRGSKSGQKVRNTEVIKKLVRGVPDDAGELSEDPVVLKEAGRIDVNLSRWVERKIRRPADEQAVSAWRLERYLTEAPANKEGAGLWMSFVYGGETYSFPDGSARVNFDSDRFFFEHGAYVRFLRDKAIGRFLASLMYGTDFETSPDTLP